MKYTCFFCGYIATQLGHFKNHILKKKKCSIFLNEIKTIDDYYNILSNNSKFNLNDTYICEFCNKNFTRKNNLNRHYIGCKKNEINLSKEISILKSKIKLLEDKNNLSINTTNNTINNYTINNILIFNYGNEDRSLLSRDFMLQLLKIPYSAPTQMIEILHFNKEYPQNMNIRVSNKDDCKSQLIENGKWTTCPKKLIINRMIDDNLYYLDIFYEEEIEKGSIKRIPNYEKFSKLYHEVMDEKLTSDLINRMNKKLNDLMEEHKLLMSYTI